MSSGRTRTMGMSTFWHRMIALIAAGWASHALAGEPVTLVQDGEARMAIVAGSEREPAERLQAFIRDVSGAQLEIVEAGNAAADGAIYVGLAEDFPDLQFDDVEALGPEGFILRSDGTNLHLIAHQGPGVQHAVTTLMHELGFRHFFMDRHGTWRIVPEQPTIEGGWNERQTPSYDIFRRLGGSAWLRGDRELWMQNNRMSDRQLSISIGHTWYGLDRESDFERNPELFALVERDGVEERRPSKPCFSNPETIERMIDFARRRAADGATSISLSPPDGLNYCQGPRCREVFQGAEPFEERATLFAERPDGLIVNITSETLFNAVNKVAEALEDDYPDVILACYAYSAYSHPPSFDMHPNVYIQPSTSYRRTPLSLEDQLTRWGERANNIGIREYWSVVQWSWHWPTVNRLKPDFLHESLRRYHYDYNVRGLNTDAGIDMGPNGLGYYVGMALMWDADTDVQALVADFYDKAFGPAAVPMERYYARFNGPMAAVSGDGRAIELSQREDGFPRDDPETARALLQEMFRDLDDAIELVRDDEDHRERVDHLRMYAYYIYLRVKRQEAAQFAGAEDDDQILIDAIRDEIQFLSRLAFTYMASARRINGNRFERYWRHQGHLGLVAGLEEVRVGEDGGLTSVIGGPVLDHDGEPLTDDDKYPLRVSGQDGTGTWRQPRVPPTHEQLNELWAAAMEDLQP